jgi:hypothetical protein
MQKNKPSYIVIDSNVLISAGAKIIISGDEDLKVLKKYAVLKYSRPQIFLNGSSKECAGTARCRPSCTQCRCRC